jgi:hypothetical protein
MNSADYIERLRLRTKTKTIYAVQKQLGLPPTTVSNYATGKRQFDNYAAMMVAALLDLEPLHVIANAEAAREKDETRRQYWQGIAKKTK